MTNDELKVWDALRGHIGINQAITRASLELKTHITDRAVRDIIRSLRNDHGKLICYSQDKPGGYFIAETINELRACRNMELSREIKVRENRQAYDKAINTYQGAQEDLFGGLHV